MFKIFKTKTVQYASCTNGHVHDVFKLGDLPQPQNFWPCIIPGCGGVIKPQDIVFVKIKK